MGKCNCGAAASRRLPEENFFLLLCLSGHGGGGRKRRIEREEEEIFRRNFYHGTNAIENLFLLFDARVGGGYSKDEPFIDGPKECGN